MRPFILVLFCLLSMILRAQLGVNHTINDADQARRRQIELEREQRLIAVRYERDAQDRYIFYCDNKAFCNYTLTIDFPEFFNLESDLPLPATVEVYPGTQRILTLKKTGSPVRLRYHFHYAKGCRKISGDSSFVYLLPISPGRETRVFELSYLGAKYAGEPKPKGFYVIGLHMHSGDTVFAARRGRVVDVREVAGPADSGTSFNREENYVDVVHDDCTFGKYIVFRDSSIFVHPGDWVEAGQPLGIVGGENYVEGPHVRFSVRYHFDQDIPDKDGQPAGRIEPWAYVPVSFWVKGKGATRLDTRTVYTSEHPAELITKEMPRKEARKWKETHPSEATTTP